MPWVANSCCIVKNIIIRALSGSIYVALIVASILLLDNSPIAFLIVFGLFIIIGISELHKLSHDVGPASWLVTVTDMAGGVGLLLAFYYYSKGTGMAGLRALPLAIYIVVRCVVQLYRPRQNAVRSLQRSFFALVYVAVPIALLNTIVSITAPRLLLAIFMFIWVNDTGAFLTGITLGRHRLFERISPKKSWEGFFGGLAACVLVALATHRWCNEFFQVPELTTWVGLSIVVAVAATFGDLTESLLKRTEGVKDSGNIIPGHGGLLDRIDSLLLDSPAALIYLSLVVYN